MTRLCGRWSGLEAEPEATGAPRCQVTMHMTREQTLIAVERLEAEADKKAEAARAWGRPWSKQQQKLKLTVDP